ncbi:hypothetical protein [Pedobacter sp. SYP-B3415]|uniref:hypothetical protein n=1 Tax=Pedobacter sp. SYP-B3415 TaxID=2496641 RepID=UPI001F0F2BA0|nr:hypothetical protein [Pedobacter sp. SYP-B3415]
MKKNREVLEKLNPQGKIVVNRAVLLKAGFNFQYHTHTYLTRKGHQYIFCYDQGYLGLESDHILLVRDDGSKR